MVYAWCLERQSTQEEFDKFQQELDDLLEWEQDSGSSAAAEAEAESFMAFMANSGG